MKRSFFLILFAGLFVWAGAQSTSQTPDLSKLHPKKTTAKKSASAKSEQASAVANAKDFLFLHDALENAFLVVKQSYNIREHGVNVAGDDFFGHVYSIVPIVEYGYIADVYFQEPWKRDRKVNRYADCKDCLYSVDLMQYSPLNDQQLRPFTMNSLLSDSIASGVFLVRDGFRQQKGMHVKAGEGVTKGYMVWFTMDEQNKVDFAVQPLTVTLNENSIFSLKQPVNVQQVIGGAFLNLSTDEPGAVRINLLGVARIDPYGSGNWELVKFQREPAALKASK